VQTAEIFEVIREILTCWLLLEDFVVTSNRLFFCDLLINFVKAKTDHHINVVHFFKKCCLVAISVLRVPRLGKKGLVKCHMSASQLLNAPTVPSAPLWLQIPRYQTLTFATSASRESS